MLKELTNLITTVGFPIGVSVFLLVRLEVKLGEILSVLSKLQTDITAVIEKNESR